MLTEVFMPTATNNRTTTETRDLMYNLEQKMRIRNFSKKTIQAYIYYNKELLRLAN